MNAEKVTMFASNIYKSTKSVNSLAQWPKEKVQKDKQRSTKHTYKTKDRVTRNPNLILNIIAYIMYTHI
jgi:hypothetical protein